MMSDLIDIKNRVEKATAKEWKRQDALKMQRAREDGAWMRWKRELWEEQQREALISKDRKHG